MRQRRYGGVASTMDEYGESSSDNSDGAPYHADDGNGDHGKVVNMIEMSLEEQINYENPIEAFRRD